MGTTLYSWLMGRATGDAFDAHCLACVIAARAREPAGETEGSLAWRLGLDETELRALLTSYFGGVLPEALAPPGEPPTQPPAPEEADLRHLLLEHRACGTQEETWFAALVAHAALRPDHLWQDMGLDRREEMSRLLRRHFPALALRNVKDMKWKKFLYKQLCEREDVRVCKAPNCEVCNDFVHCFGAEDGPPLSQLGRMPPEWEVGRRD